MVSPEQLIIYQHFNAMKYIKRVIYNCYCAIEGKWQEIECLCGPQHFEDTNLGPIFYYMYVMPFYLVISFKHVI